MFALFRKLWYNTRMAKAKTIKYKQGEVIASGLTKEQIVELEALLEGKPTEAVFNETKQEYELVEIKSVELSKEEPVLNNRALSLVKVDKIYNCITVAYNLETKEARVVLVEPLHSNKNIADSKFSLKLYKEIYQK